VPEHKAETRIRILDSARRLFNRNGLTAISIDEVMAGAVLTRAASTAISIAKSSSLPRRSRISSMAAQTQGWQRMAFADRPEGRALARARSSTLIFRTTTSTMSTEAASRRYAVALAGLEPGHE
jgi:hypothetical protein